MPTEWQHGVVHVRTRHPAPIRALPCRNRAWHGKHRGQRASTFCMAMLAFSPAGKKLLEAMRDFWSAGAEGFLPNVTFVDIANGYDAAATQVYGMLLDALAEFTVRQRRACSRCSGNTRLFASLRNCRTRSIQSKIILPARRSRRLGLHLPASPPETVGPQKSNQPFQLTQLLPLPSQGLAALELHTQPANSDAEGLLAISTATCEDGRVFGEWAIPYSAVPTAGYFSIYQKLTLRRDNRCC